MKSSQEWPASLTYIIRDIFIAMNGKQVIAKLKTAGWTLVRVRGGHHLLSKDGKTVPVPVHGTAEIGKGLLAEIERQTGVKLK